MRSHSVTSNGPTRDCEKKLAVDFLSSFYNVANWRAQAGAETIHIIPSLLVAISDCAVMLFRSLI